MQQLSDEIKEELKANLIAIRQSLAEHLDDIIEECVDGTDGLNTPELVEEANRFVGKRLLWWFSQILEEDQKEEEKCGKPDKVPGAGRQES